MLLFLCWLFAILIPVVMPLAFHFLRWITALAIVTILCLVPSLLCKLRYTAGRRAALSEHYRGLKHPGRRLVSIILAAVALMLANFASMFRLGFYTGTDETTGTQAGVLSPGLPLVTGREKWQQAIQSSNLPPELFPRSIAVKTSKDFCRKETHRRARPGTQSPDRRTKPTLPARTPVAEIAPCPYRPRLSMLPPARSLGFRAIRRRYPFSFLSVPPKKHTGRTDRSVRRTPGAA